MTEKKVQCPECDAVFKIDLPEAQPGDLKPVTIKDISELLKPAPDLDHRHKTADEFMDCPECRLWFDKTAQRYQVTEKEPTPPPEPPPAEKPEDQPGEGEEKPGEEKPEPVAAKAAFGSVFKKGGEHGQE